MKCFWLSALVLIACSSSSTRAPAQKDAGVASVADAPPVTIDASERKVFITGAGRCGECHGKMFDEWETSAHANAVSSPLYKTAVAAARDATCGRCHAPLAQLAPRDVTVTEGVTCDVCHTLREPKPGPEGGGFTLEVYDMVKFGPRCDLKDHYFHRMGCSKEHREAELCGSCHWWEPKGIPVFTEYADWKSGAFGTQPRSPGAAKGLTCQDCHMPKERAALATGSPVRNGVPHHGLLGLARDLRTRALGFSATLQADGTLAIVVSNVTAGHAVPAGLPERRIVVRARVRDAANTVTWHGEVALGRKLVDASGAEVPFWRAVKVGDDTRVQVGKTQEVKLAVPVAGAGKLEGKLEIELAYRGLSDAVANELGVTDVEEQRMTHGKLDLRGTYPKTLAVKPPAAGARPPARKGPKP